MDRKVYQYRKRHPRCTFCKYYHTVFPLDFFGTDFYYFECKAKDKVIRFPDMLRLCSCYEVKEVGENNNKFIGYLRYKENLKKERENDA